MSQIVVKRMALTSHLMTQRVRVKRDVMDPAYLLPLLLGILSVVMVSIFYIWVHLEIIKLGYEVSEAARHQIELTQENKRLKIEFSNLKSPERIERIARERLNLHYPMGEEVVMVK